MVERVFGDDLCRVARVNFICPYSFPVRCVLGSSARSDVPDRAGDGQRSGGRQMGEGAYKKGSRSRGLSARAP